MTTRPDGDPHGVGQRPMGDEDLRMEAMTPDAEYFADIAAARELPEAKRQAARDRAFAAAAERGRRSGSG